MDHAQIQERFSDYWDESLEAPARAEVDAHLSGCAECRAEYEAFEKAMTPLGKLHRMAAPEKLQEQVPEIINRRSRGRFFAPRKGLERLPVEWLSLGMLGLIALVYLLLKLMHPAVRLP